MTKYLAGVLTVIAMGVLLVAYGLMNARVTMDASTALSPAVRPAGLSEPVSMQMQAVPYGGAPPASGYVAVAAPSGYVASGYVPAYATVPVTYASAPGTYAQPAVITAPAPRQAPTVAYAPEPTRRTSTRRIESKPRSDWKRTAMIVGGSSAAGAGLGAIFGGKKGALIGAAIGGGAGTIYEVTK